MPALDRRVDINGLPLYGAFGVPTFPTRNAWGQVLEAEAEDTYLETGTQTVADLKLRVRYSQALLRARPLDVSVIVDGIDYRVQRIQVDETGRRRRFITLLCSRSGLATGGAPVIVEPDVPGYVVTPAEAMATPTLRTTDTPGTLARTRIGILRTLTQRDYQVPIAGESEADRLRRMFLDPWLNPGGELIDGPFASPGFFDDDLPYAYSGKREAAVRLRYYADAPTIVSVSRDYNPDRRHSGFRIELTPIDEETYPVSDYRVEYRAKGHPFAEWRVMPNSTQGTESFKSAPPAFGNRDDHWPLVNGNRIFWRQRNAFSPQRARDLLTLAPYSGNPILEFRAYAAWGVSGHFDSLARIAGPYSAPVTETVREADTRSRVVPVVAAPTITRDAGATESHVYRLRPLFTVTWTKLFPDDALDGYEVEIQPYYSRSDWPRARTTILVEGNPATPAKGTVTWQWDRRAIPLGTSADDIAATPFAARVRTYRDIDDGRTIRRYWSSQWSAFARDIT